MSNPVFKFETIGIEVVKPKRFVLLIEIVSFLQEGAVIQNPTLKFLMILDMQGSGFVKG